MRCFRRDGRSMSAPLILVALATYNGERYLCEQLESVLAQVDVAIEIIAVDDGSSDGTLAILNDYGAATRVSKSTRIRRTSALVQRSSVR